MARTAAGDAALLGGARGGFHGGPPPRPRRPAPSASRSTSVMNSWTPPPEAPRNSAAQGLGRPRRAPRVQE